MGVNPSTVLMASASAQHQWSDIQFDGCYPNVRRKSSLLTYLELCKAGAKIDSGTLMCELLKHGEGAAGEWSGYPKGDMTAREIVAEMNI